MSRTMITATNTLSQLQKKMDIISNNLANSDTNGYKRKEATFSEFLTQQFNIQPDLTEEIGRLTPNGVRQGVGAKLGQTQLILDQGSIKSTGRELDFALRNGRQFFKVGVQNGETSEVRYTRNGAFYISPFGDGTSLLVNGQGHPILDSDDEPIRFSEDVDSFTLGGRGNLVVKDINGNVEEFNFGVVTIEKPQFMEQYGENLLGLPANMDNLNVQEQDILTNLESADRNMVNIGQAQLEASNVNVGQEMVDLINVQRSYQFQTRTISIADQMMGLVNGIR